MKTLHHPAVENVTVEGILHALSDPVRVQILKEIIRSNSPKMCSDFLNMSLAATPLLYALTALDRSQWTALTTN